MDSQKTPPSLRELQLWMRWVVTDPRGVRDALAEPYPADRPNIARYTSPSKTALPWISEAPPIDTATRLDIYAEAYFSRVLDSMQADFPITLSVLGENSFQKLISDYLKQHPSQTPNIGEIGRSFSMFAATYEDLKGAEFLPDVIDLEWKSILSFYADDSGVISASKLSSLTDEDWERAKLRIAPSVFLLSSTFALDQIWHLREDSSLVYSTDFDASEASRQFLIFRDAGTVSCHAISRAEFLILQKLKSGTSLISAIEETQTEILDPEIGELIMTWFNGWVAQGIIFDIELKTETVNS